MGDTSMVRQCSELSGQELAVLRLFAGGQTSAEIAGTLHLDIGEVTACRRSIMQRFAIRSIAGLTKFAFQYGFR